MGYYRPIYLKKNVTFCYLISIEKVCMTVSGPASGKPCIFPFNRKSGKEYNECTWAAELAPWCSTKVNSDGYHIAGNWGYCNQTECPIEPRGNNCGISCDIQSL